MLAFFKGWRRKVGVLLLATIENERRPGDKIGAFAFKDVTCSTAGNERCCHDL